MAFALSAYYLCACLISNKTLVGPASRTFFTWMPVFSFPLISLHVSWLLDWNLNCGFFYGSRFDGLAIIAFVHMSALFGLVVGLLNAFLVLVARDKTILRR